MTTKVTTPEGTIKAGSQKAKRSSTHIEFVTFRGDLVVIPKLAACVYIDGTTDNAQVFNIYSGGVWTVSKDTAKSVLDEIKA